MVQGNDMMDKKAKKILFDTYWKNGGWVDEKDMQLSEADFLYAKEKGLMFEPMSISHDECLIKIHAVAAKVGMNKAAKAFLSSLSLRRLDLRSGLASFAFAERLPLHSYTPTVSGYSYDDNGEICYTNYSCDICGDLLATGDEYFENEDLNVLNFERIKWGGVRLGNLVYTLFNLQQLEVSDIPEPTAEDIEIFNAILTVIENSAPDDSPRALEKNLASVLKSSKIERDVLIEILACVGILEAVSYDRRRIPGKPDWTFATYWRGEDKYNKEVVQKYFGKYLNR
jgi:hypothetical protein